MSRRSHSTTPLEGYAPRTITSSTDATPIVVTTGAHGYSTGQTITVNGHTTNTNANGFWTITVLSPTTFSLDGSEAQGAGAGGNDGCHCLNKGAAHVKDYKSCMVSFDTDGGGDAAMVVKLVGSIQEEKPDFAAPKGPGNRYSEIYMNDQEDPSESIAGDTGFVVAGADDNRLFEANTNGLTWLGVLPVSGTEGEITVELCRFNNQ